MASLVQFRPRVVMALGSSKALHMRGARRTVAAIATPRPSLTTAAPSSLSALLPAAAVTTATAATTMLAHRRRPSVVCAGLFGGGGATAAAAAVASKVTGAAGGTGLGAKLAAAAAGLGLGLKAWPWLALLAVLLAGVAAGLAIAKLAARAVEREFDVRAASLENRELRERVEQLQQLVVKLEPLAYKDMRLRFTRGVNKAVILGMVDQMLSNREVNIPWLPDAVERLLYVNVITLMLQVLDEIVESMSVSFAGHNVKLSLTYLDVERGEGGESPAAASKTAELLRAAIAPVPSRGGGSGGSSGSSSGGASSVDGAPAAA